MCKPLFIDETTFDTRKVNPLTIKKLTLSSKVRILTFYKYQF